MRTRILDQGVDSEVASNVIEIMDDLGYSSIEAIPGLVRAIVLLSEFTNDPTGALDEAANLLADADWEGK